MSTKRLVVTGADGFIGRNLCLRLSEEGAELRKLVRSSSDDEIADALAWGEVVIHLAGANRPDDPTEFMEVNRGMTERLAELARLTETPLEFIYASTARALDPSDYGRSKLAAEQILQRLSEDSSIPVRILRLPNVFGKWARPNYNSAVATFCHNVARNLPIEVHDPAAKLNLVYVDDVVEAIWQCIAGTPGVGFVDVSPVYATTVGAVADMIRGFHRDRPNGLIGAVGCGLERALYSTYVSYLPIEDASYPITSHSDARGTFIEMLRTRSSGQFSVLTAHPGVTRGGHYHHTKTEKFLVIEGRAQFRFRHVLSGETREIEVDGNRPRVVETIPGWAHSIANIGEGPLISLLWANELFDPEHPDTIAIGV